MFRRMTATVAAQESFYLGAPSSYLHKRRV